MEEKTIHEQLADAKAELKSLQTGVKSADDEAISRAKEIVDEIIPALEEQVAKAVAQQEILAAIDEADEQTEEIIVEEQKQATTLGQKAALAVAEKSVARGDRVQAKANTDVHVVGGFGDTVVDKNVTEFLGEDDILSLFNIETIDGNAFTYFVEGEAEGDFDVVDENGLKPQIHFNYDEKTEKLAKIAAFYKETDELLYDASWLASSIDTRALRMLRKRLQGYVLGRVLNTEGVLVVPTAAGDNKSKAQAAMDTILDAQSQIKAQSDLDATAVFVNPLDWAEIRKAVDSNGQYYAGSAFGYDYGNGHGATTLWGMQVRTSSAVEQGTALVGAVYEAGSVFQNQSGEQVEVANMNEDDFIHNRITIVAEKRLGVAIRKPMAWAKATLGL